MHTMKLVVLLYFTYDLFQPLEPAICTIHECSFHRTAGHGRKSRNLRSGAEQLKIFFGVKRCSSGVGGLFFLCLVTLRQLASFLLGSWGL